MNESFMDVALEQAKLAYKEDEVPIGCVIVKNNEIIATGYNQKEKTKDATSHAEIVAIRKACEYLKSWYLDGCDIYVTVEPCPMCAGAIMLSRIENVYYGAKNKKFGAIDSNIKLYKVGAFNHHPYVVSGIKEEEAKTLMKNYFKDKRV